MSNYGNNIIEAVRDYFMDCPLLKDGVLNIDYLEGKTIGYSINTEMNANQVLRSYCDGGKLMQYPFSFMSAEIRSQDVLDQIQACGFYEDLQEWIEKQNEIGNLPNIEGIQSIEVKMPGCIVSADSEVAFYQIQCRLTYLKEA